MATKIDRPTAPDLIPLGSRVADTLSEAEGYLISRTDHYYSTPTVGVEFDSHPMAETRLPAARIRKIAGSLAPAIRPKWYATH